MKKMKPNFSPKLKNKSRDDKNIHEHGYSRVKFVASNFYLEING